MKNEGSELKILGVIAILALVGGALLVLPSLLKNGNAAELPLRSSSGARGASLAAAEAAAGQSQFSVSDTEITVYQPSGGSLAHIREKRAFDLVAGRNNVVISDVSDGVEPSSLLVSDLSDSTTVLLEQTYTPALSDSDMLRNYIGETIIVRQGNSTVSGKLLSRSPLTLETDEGMRLFYSYDSISLGKIGNKPLKPAISLFLDAKSGGKHDLVLSYLSSGITWSSDYSLTVDEESSDLYALATVDNNAGTSYKLAKVALVAGDIARESYYYGGRYALSEMATGAPSAAPDITATNVFEFKSYELPRPIDLADGESKQVPFLTRSGVKSKKTYAYEGGKAVKTELLIKNEKADGLGTPLPSGKVRMFVKKDGASVYIGEGSIGNTAENENITLGMGSAFDLSGETRQVDYVETKCTDTYSYAITLRNSKEIPVAIEVREYFGGDYEITKENFQHEDRSQSQLVWKIPVKAGSTETLAYTVMYDYPYRKDCGSA